MHEILATLLPLLQEEGGAEPSGSSVPGLSLFPLVLVFVIFWFVLIGPERKQRKRRQAMIEALKKGDRVLTSGGIYGTVVQAQDDVITVQVADNVRLRFAKPAIQTVLPEEGAAKDESRAASGDKAEKNEKKQS